jgi:uncharacterized OB-fold protein
MCGFIKKRVILMTKKTAVKDKSERGLYAVYCLDCGRFLCEAPANTATYCPNCRRWTKYDPKMEVKKDV